MRHGPFLLSHHINSHDEIHQCLPEVFPVPQRSVGGTSGGSCLGPLVNTQLTSPFGGEVKLSMGSLVGSLMWRERGGVPSVATITLAACCSQ